MNLLQLENENSFLMVYNILSDLSAASYPENIQAIFSDMFTRKYDKVLDGIITSKYGRREVSDYMLQELSIESYSYLYEATIKNYLLEKAMFIRQCMAYEDAEYNPIENYSQTEHETTDTTIGERDFTDTKTENPYSKSIEHDYKEHIKTNNTPQIISESYTEANIVTEKEELKTTTETKNAPFESSDYFSKEKVEVTPGKVTETEKPYNRKVKTPQVTVTETDQAHKIIDTESIDSAKVETFRHLSQEAEDGIVRDLSRSGNIGVQTAAQMMQYDSSWWRSNTWLTELATGIVNLLCEDVVAI